MTARTLDLHIDLRQRRLIRDAFSNLQIIPQDLVQGDSYNVRLIVLEASTTGDPSRLWSYVELPTSCYVAIGTPGQRPASGTFTLTWGGDTTSALAYNASAATVQTALNALASITSAGGVTVSASTDGGPYQITWNNVGSRAAITGEPAALYPISVITVYTDREGTGSLREIQILSLDRSPAALAETFTAIASPTGSVTTLQAGASGTPEIQRIQLDQSTHDGTFTLTFSGQTTSALAYNITATDLATALAALSNIAPADVLVTGAFPRWDVTFQGALTDNQPQMTLSAAGLIGPQGVEGILNLATGGIEQLLDGAKEIETELEVVIQLDGQPVTILQSAITVQNDLIPNAPASTTGGPTYHTASEVDALLADKADNGDIAASGLTTTGIGIIGRLSSGTGALQLIPPSAAIADAATDAATDAPTDAPTDASTSAAVDAPVDAPVDASTSHALNSTFDDVEVETALNNLGTKLNSTAGKLNSTAAKYNAAAALYNAAAAKLNSTATKYNAAAVKLNAATAKYNAAAAKLNTLIAQLEASGILTP